MVYKNVPEPSFRTFHVLQIPFDRRSFLTTISAAMTVTACGGSEGNSGYVQLPEKLPESTPKAVATSTPSTLRKGIAPSPAWTGVAGSGFSGSPPSDPTRLTAKPILRPLQAPNQWFTDQLAIAVWAGANDNGTLNGNLGLQKVILHYEGNSVDILEPTVREIVDANGVYRSYFGWWADILKPDNSSGHSHVYWEAIPKDSTMQRRVIGPFQFSPQSSAHDATLTVAKSAPVLTGSNYQSLSAALDWCRANARQNPLITIIEKGNYELNPISSTYQGEGYATISADAPVTILRSGLSAATKNYFRPLYVGLKFRGSNITIDFENIAEFFCEF